MRHSLSLLCMLTLASACGCITSSAEDTASADPAKVVAPQKAAEPVSAATLPEARVKKEWQDFLVKTLDESGAEGFEAYGLFSAGGWADAGQVMIIVHKTKAPRLLVVQTGHAKVDIDRSLTAEEWKTLQPLTADAATLSSIDVTAFDALEFEFAHASKPPSGAAIDRRFYYLNAGHKNAARHEALIAAFQLLRKKI